MRRVLAIRYPGCCGAHDVKSASDIIVMGTFAESATLIGHVACFLLSVYAVQRQALEKLLFFACQPRMLSPKFTAKGQGSGSRVKCPGFGTEDQHPEPETCRLGDMLRSLKRRKASHESLRLVSPAPAANWRAGSPNHQTDALSWRSAVYMQIVNSRPGISGRTRDSPKL
jgi:hypothetical protein